LRGLQLYYFAKDVHACQAGALIVSRQFLLTRVDCVFSIYILLYNIINVCVFCVRELCSAHCIYSRSFLLMNVTKRKSIYCDLPTIACIVVIVIADFRECFLNKVRHNQCTHKM
jgi:hypothetical protein